jgi:hypothetical protein
VEWQGDSDLSFPQEIYCKDDSIVSRRIEDEVILVPIRQNVADLESIYTLNEVGAFIWEQIDGQRTTADLLALTVEEFEVSEEGAGKDLMEFIRQLSAIGALTKV